MNPLHYVGKLCRNGHRHEGSNQSVRRRSTSECVNCKRDRYLAARTSIKPPKPQRSRKNTIEDFWAQIQTGRPDQCWPWIGRTDEDGYGKIQIDGHTFLTHRLAFEIDRGFRPVGDTQVLHHCDNPPCCNPRCLFAGTAIDNVKDRVQKGRTATCESHGAAKMNWPKVRALREDRTRGMPVTRLAVKYGISTQQVSNICLQRNWKEDGESLLFANKVVAVQVETY